VPMATASFSAISLVMIGHVPLEADNTVLNNPRKNHSINSSFEPCTHCDVLTLVFSYKFVP